MFRALTIYIFFINFFLDEFFPNFDLYNVNSGNKEIRGSIKGSIDHRKRILDQSEIPEKKIEKIKSWFGFNLF